MGIQRMGRTGRKRDGRIVMLMSEGREEHTYNTSVYQKKNLLKNMINGDKLANFLCTDAPHLIPKHLSPRCHEMPMTVVQKQLPITNGRKKVNFISNSLVTEMKIDSFHMILTKL